MSVRDFLSKNIARETISDLNLLHCTKHPTIPCILNDVTVYSEQSAFSFSFLLCGHVERSSRMCSSCYVAPPYQVQSCYVALLMLYHVYSVLCCISLSRAQCLAEYR